ncbi:hypothetical protein ACEPAG_2151 [Sanghuangporus baumii]
MSDNSTFARIFVDLEAASDMGNHEFIDDGPKDQQAHLHPPSPPQPSSPVINDVEEAEAVAARYRQHSKRARTGPAPYETSDNAIDRQLRLGNYEFPAEAGDVDDTSYRMYTLKRQRARKQVQFVRAKLPPNCLVFFIPIIANRLYFWVPDVRHVIRTYERIHFSLHPDELKLVPSREVASIFDLIDRYKTGQAGLQVGNWVRIRSGRYRGDLGIVREIPAGNVLKIAVVPRIPVNDSEQTDKLRPQQCLATMEWLRVSFPEEGIDEMDDGSYVFRGKQYRDGLRILRLSGLGHVEATFPSLQDVFMFRHTHLGDLQDVEYYVRRGDIVQLFTEELNGMVGVVVEVDRTVVSVGQLRRMDSLPVPVEINGKLPRRVEALAIIEKESPEDDKIGIVKVDIKSIRRLLDEGDEVVVKVGQYAEDPAIIVSVLGDTLGVHISVKKPILSLPRFWVQTIDPSQSSVSHSHWNSTIESGSVAIILKGFFKGTIKRVVDVTATHATFTFPINGPTDTNKIHVDVPLQYVTKIPPTVFDHGQIPGVGAERYEKSTRSPFEGMFVLIRNADGKDLKDDNTKRAKGKYGYVTSVDAELGIARVAYLGSEATFPLRSLVSVDYVFCLDTARPLSRKEIESFSRRFNELAHEVRGNIMIPRERTPPRDLPNEPSCSLSSEFPAFQDEDLMFDYSMKGMWIFDPAVQALYANHKVFVRSRSYSRAGYITGFLEQDHMRCHGFGHKCRVQIHIDWSRTISPTYVDVSDIDVCCPFKKGQRVIRVTGPDRGKVFMVTGVPRFTQGHKKIAISELSDRKRRWELPMFEFTKIESANS